VKEAILASEEVLEGYGMIDLHFYHNYLDGLHPQNQLISLPCAQAPTQIYHNLVFTEKHPSWMTYLDLHESKEHSGSYSYFQQL
jgi:hypothetical protein